MKRRRRSDPLAVLRHAIAPALAAGAVVVSCGGPPPGGTGRDARAEAGADSLSIEDALAEHTAEWMAIDGVEGTGIGECEGVPCIRIFVSRPPAEFAEALPDRVGRHPVRLEPTGRFQTR